MLKSLFPWKHHKTKATAAQQTMDDEVPEVNLENQELHPCRVCGRTFLPSPLKKHERICEKTSTKKRKPFDSLKQRVEGTDLANFHQKTYLRKPEPVSTPDLKRKTRSNWKEKHLALVSAIRAAKGIPSEESALLPKTKSTTALMAGTERCPSCDRQFGPKAYDRHVEWCKEKKAQQRIHHSPANVLLAKERLEARTKYVPPLNRSKKTIIREKYSAHTSTETLVSVKSSSPLSRGPSVRKPRSVVDVGVKTNEKANGEDRKERPKFEKGTSGGGDKARAQEGGERCLPVIASPSSKAELSKNSLQKKKTGVTLTKLNDVDINSQFDGLTVASLLYDTTTKKMVTWKDTVKKSTGDRSYEENCAISSSATKDKCSELTCRVTQSEKLRKQSKKLQCDKILSCNDVIHKNQPKKIPLSKYSFKSKLNLAEDRKKQTSHKTDEVASVDSDATITVKSSNTDLDLEIDRRSSCNSVTTAFQKLKIDSGHNLIGGFEEESPKPLEKMYTDNQPGLKLEEIEDVPQTLELLKIDSRPDLVFEEIEEKNCDEVLESDSLIEIPLKCDFESVLATKSELDAFQSNRKDMSKWFDDYVKKNECAEDEEPKIQNEIERIPQIDEEEARKVQRKHETNENLVLLFRSNTELDLTKGTSDLTLTGKKSENPLMKDVSEETFDTNCELDSVELSFRRASHFSLKKSTSDMYLGSVQSSLGVSSKNTLVSIYWNKNKEISDEESFMESRKTFNSLPNIPIKEVFYKEEATEDTTSTYDGCKEKTSMQKEVMRRKILEIAAKEFVEDCKSENAPPEEEGSSSDDPLLRFLEEEYTVPKKRRKMDSVCTKRSKRKVFRFSGTERFSLDKFKALIVSSSNPNILESHHKDNSRKNRHKDDDLSELSSLSSARSDSTLCDTSSIANYSPRIFAILDNVLNVHRRSVEDDKNLVVMTPSDCRRLIDLDKEKLPQLRRHLKKLKRGYTKRSLGRLQLPAIEDAAHSAVKEDKEIQVDETLRLPRIVDRKLRRRENVKKLEVDDVKRNVYLEYDNERNILSYNPFESAQRQFMELLQCDDFKGLTPTCTPVKQSQRPHTSDVTPLKQSSPSTNKKTIKSADSKLAKVTRKTNRASVIDPPSNFKDSLDSISDDFELMENLINDNFTDDNTNNNDGFFLHFKPDKESLTLSDILDNRKYSDDMSSIDPMLINENDNLSIPDHFRIDDYSPTSTIDTDITIQNDVDHYSVQYDKKIEEYEPKVGKKIRENSPIKPKTEKKPIVKRSVSLVNRTKTDDTPLRVTSKKLTNKSKLTSKSVSSVASTKTNEKKKGLSSLKKSMTLFEPSPKPPQLKTKNDVNNYFTEQDQKLSTSIERTSPAKELGELLDDTLKPEDLFNVDDEMYEEYKKYEEMYLKEKAQKSTTKKHKPKIVDVGLGVHTASEEEEQSPQFNNKISNDSAYGSLTRKTPKHRSRATKLTPLEQKQPDSTSSSGSEHCPTSPALTNQQRLSKFCHECGNKYPLTTAKFCVECGVRRLVL